MDIQKIPVAELKAAAYNPRKDLRPGDAEYEKLKRSIDTYGIVQPVIWNKTTGNVVGGHQRLKVLVDLGHTEIDCVVVELDDASEKSLNVALNKISGDWDTEKLAGLLDGLVLDGFDVSLTGFAAAEVAELFDYSDIPEEKPFDREVNGKKKRLPVLKISQYSVPMEDDEWSELLGMVKSYVEKNGTAHGFVRLLLGGKNAN